MSHRSTHRRLAGIIASTAIIAAASMVSAPPALAASSGPYSGFAHGSVVHVDALNAANMRVADLEVGLSNAAVNSEGLDRILNEYSREIVPDLPQKNSYGSSSIAELGVVHAPDAANQIAPFKSESSSPGGTKVDKAVLSQTVNPALHVDVLRNVADSRWNADSCVIGSPIALGSQHVARAQVLEQSADPNTPEFDGALVGVNADNAGPERALTTLTSVEQLYDGGGDGFGLQSATAATLAPVTLFEGTANEITIEASGPAVLSAAADGTKGGADVVFDVPLVSIIRGGEVTQALPGDEIIIELPPNGNDLVVSIKIGVLQESNEAANGTSASAVANVVEVKILDITSQNVRGATIAIGHLEAASKVPAGGIACTIPVRKAANPKSVSVGDLFTVTIEVENVFSCPLSNVTLTDDTSVKKDARFEFVKASSKGKLAKGSSLSKGVASWDLGSIAPGETKTVTVTLLAQGGAGLIEDIASATGSLDNCAIGLAKDSAAVFTLAKVKVPVSGIGTLTVPESRVLGETKLPSTGIASTALLGSVLLSASGATAFAARRRRS